MQNLVENDFAQPSRRRLFLALYLIFISLSTLCYGILNVHIRSSWAIGEWLINYRGGFVRRGLTGEFALIIAHFFHVSPLDIVLLIQLLLYGVVFYAVWKLLDRSSWNLWVIAFLISPATLAFPVLDPPTGFRKEIILFAGLSALLLILRRPVRRDVWLIVAFSLFVVLCVLSHEPQTCFMPYLLAALAIGLRDIQRSLKISALPIALAIATAALVAHHPGTPQMAVQICSSLGYTNPQSFPGLCNGAIAYIGRDTQYARTDVINGIHAYHYYRLYGLLAPLVALPILMAFVRLWRYPSLRRDLYILATIALLSIAASTPLFLYGEDWGRWIYVHTVCIFLLLLFIDCRRQLDPATTEPQFTLPANRAKRVALILLLIAYATCWDLPHVGIYQSRTGYFGLAHYFYQYRSTHPSQPNAAQLP